jgi:hypothetical protein
MMIDGFYSQNSRGPNLSAQDKRGALSISPSIVDLLSIKVLLVVDEGV